MNRNDERLLLGSAILALLMFPHASMADARCNDRTIKGAYIYASTGVRDGAPYVEAGQDIFDGKGGITNTYTDTNGQTVVTKGSYQMNANCVSQAKYDDSGVNYVMYTGPTGSEFSWISVTPGTKITGREVRVSTSLTPKCSLKTLKGTYVYSLIGYRDGVQYIESGQEVFDGKGSIRNTFTDASGMTVTTAGTYLMGDHCIGETRYQDTGDTYSVYVDPKGDSFTYASMISRSGNLAVGSERRVGKQVK
jgi:hypothetical protein